MATANEALNSEISSNYAAMVSYYKALASYISDGNGVSPLATMLLADITHTNSLNASQNTFADYACMAGGQLAEAASDIAAVQRGLALRNRVRTTYYDEMVNECAKEITLLASEAKIISSAVNGNLPESHSKV